VLDFYHALHLVTAQGVSVAIVVMTQTQGVIWVSISVVIWGMWSLRLDLSLFGLDLLHFRQKTSSYPNRLTMFELVMHAWYLVADCSVDLAWASN